jgi:hypothetical protein
VSGFFTIAKNRKTLIPTFSPKREKEKYRIIIRNDYILIKVKHKWYRIGDGLSSNQSILP